jgi:hypothetical protein
MTAARWSAARRGPRASTSNWPAASIWRATRATAAISNIWARIRCWPGLWPGSSIKGIQDQNVVSTVKHFALNGQETNRHWANSVIEEGAHRESDLLAFQIAIEKGQPGSVMCAYNLVNGDYSCGNDHLLNTC